MKKKTITLVALCVLFSTILTIIFFSYNPIITYDSSHYLWLTDMLTSNSSFSNWDVARGISFPIIIFVLNILFGISSNSLLIGMYICYLLMIITCCLIYKDTIIADKLISKKGIIFSIIMFVVLIAFNPIVFGYYHVLLTEFVAITISIIMCYISWKFIYIDYEKSKIKYCIYTIIFILSCIYSWHLKQPYISVALFPIIIANILLLFGKQNKINKIMKSLTTILCIVGIVASIVIWNGIMRVNNVNFKSGRTSEGFFTKMLVEGVSNYTRYFKEFDEEKYTYEGIVENDNINEGDKNKMLDILNDTSSEYKSFIIFDEKEKEQDKVIFLKDDELTTKDAIAFVGNILMTNPVSLIEGYIANYFTAINVYKLNHENGINKLYKDFELFHTAENIIIPGRIYNSELANLFPGLSDEFSPYARPYEETYQSIPAFNFYMLKSQKFAVLVFKFVFLALPLLLLISIVLYLKRKNKISLSYKKTLELIIILYGFGFLHILSHVLVGASIDRYTLPAYITTIMGISLSIYLVAYKNKISKQESVKNRQLD